MRHVVSIGGGIASTLLLPLWVIAKHGKRNVDLVMAKLPNEDSDVWRLCERIEDFTGLPITYIGSNQTPWDVFHGVRNINAVVKGRRTDPCSYQLKREVTREYIQQSYKPGQAIIYAGIGADEAHRAVDIVGKWRTYGYTADCPLIDDWRYSRAASMQFCQSFVGFVPLLYRLGFDHNNCGGGCIKAGHYQWAMLWWHSRQGLLKTHEGIPTFEWWRDNETLFRQTVNPNVAILRDWKNAGKPLSLVEFEQRLEAKMSSFLPGFEAIMMNWKDVEARLDPAMSQTPGCAACEAA